MEGRGGDGPGVCCSSSSVTVAPWGKKVEGRLPWRWLVLALLALLVLFTRSTPSTRKRSAWCCASASTCATREPGLHFKLPFGVETVIKVPVQRQFKEEFGFRTEEAGVRTQYSDHGASTTSRSCSPAI